MSTRLIIALIVFPIATLIMAFVLGTIPLFASWQWQLSIIFGLNTAYFAVKELSPRPKRRRRRD